MVFDNLKVIGFIVVLLPFYSKWRNGTDFVYEEIWIWLLVGFIFITNIPAILIYLNYYLENKNTEFTLDYNEEKILITQNGIQKEYSKNDISKSTYHLGIYYKNAIDRAGRIPMLISDFGYWDLQFKNGDRYYLTNILHDFIHDAPKVPKTKYRFRFYPYINKSDSKKAVEFIEKKEKTRIEYFVEKYSEMNIKQLNEILENKSGYQKEAIKAAEIVLKNKNVG